ncbi:MAG TPA: hypothetical protein VFT59_01425, partial [Candidatus Saccharimonadales bacterium]|nr:hypothetical protein [Candidatus Saccharimonadales bacterium]
MTNSSTSSTRYTTFYLVMLILTSLSVGFSMVSILASIPDLARTMSFAPAYTVLQYIAAALTLLVVPILVLMWLKKNPLGIRLLLGAYVVLIITGIATLFFLDPVVKDATELTIKNSPDLAASDVAPVAGAMLYGLNIIIIIFNIVLAVLWWFAYRNQQRADDEE